MDAAQTLAPQYRVEISVADLADAPWYLYFLGATEAQCTAKIAREKLTSLRIASRVVHNETITAPEPTNEVPAEFKLVLHDVQNENLNLRAENMRLKAAARIAAMPVTKVDALAGLSPLPFEVGQIVRDNFTGNTVRVVALNPASPKKPDVPRSGFGWEILTGRTADPQSFGFVPLQSVGCFRALAPGENSAAVEVETEEPAVR